MTSLYDNLNEGEDLRDSALDLLRWRRAELVRQCTIAVLHIALECVDLCADDVRAIVAIPQDISPKLVGVVFRDLSDAGIIRATGEHRRSRRREAHARTLPIWRLANSAAARTWLADHPPLAAD